MYEYQNGGYGSDLEFEKETGEIIQYHDLKHEVLKEIGGESDSGKTLSIEVIMKSLTRFYEGYYPERENSRQILVAIANALGLLPADGNQFKPDEEVTYADLAVSKFRLASEVYERGAE